MFFSLVVSAHGQNKEHRTGHLSCRYCAGIHKRIAKEILGFARALREVNKLSENANRYNIPHL